MLLWASSTRDRVSDSVWETGPKLYDTYWVSRQMIWENVSSPGPRGSSSATALISSPNPWPKSVLTLKWCWA